MAQDLFIRIEDYLDNVLSPAERQAFEEQLRANPELAQTVAIVREARERLVRQWANEPADTALIETLRQIGQDYFKGEMAEQPKALSVQLFQRIWWAAAAVLVLLTAAWLFFLRPPQHERLYAQYRDLPKASFAVRGADGIITAERAAEAFNRKQYEEALLLIREYLAQNPEDVEARYFEGLSLLELSRSAEARAVLAQIEKVPAWADEARWYVALSYLRENEMELCRQQLEQIPAESGRHAQAQQLLKRISH